MTGSVKSYGCNATLLTPFKLLCLIRITTILRTHHLESLNVWKNDIVEGKTPGS